MKQEFLNLNFYFRVIRVYLSIFRHKFLFISQTLFYYLYFFFITLPKCHFSFVTVLFISKIFFIKL